MRIGELSARSGVSIRLLRYYEQQGLIRPSRQANGYRAYAEHDVQLVRLIRALVAAGICTPMIARILPSICEQDGMLIPCTAELADELRRERDRIDRRISELVESRRALDLAIEAAPKPPPLDGARAAVSLREELTVPSVRSSLGRQGQHHREAAGIAGVNAAAVVAGARPMRTDKRDPNVPTDRGQRRRERK